MTLQINSKPIVHIAADEKFIDTAYEIYEKAFPGKNRFFILYEEDEERFRHLSKAKEYEIIEISDDYLSLIRKKLSQVKIVVYHGMNFYQMWLAQALKDNNLITVWTVFGFEVFRNPYLFGKEIYGRKTYRRFVFNLKDIVKNWIRPFYFMFLGKERDTFKAYLDVLREMDYVGVLAEEEYANLEHRIGLRKNIKQLRFTYYPLGLIKATGTTLTGDNILLGNSARSTNNHLEAFDRLKGIDLGNRKIIVPLSYGNEEYASEIIKIGNRLFGDKFCPLIKYLPLNEYQEILQTCSVVIMNNYRQQGVGNVLNSLYYGAKIYLSKKNTVYHYLKRLDCLVFSIDEDLKGEKVFERFSQNQIKEHKRILEEELNMERIVSELRQELSSEL